MSILRLFYRSYFIPSHRMESSSVVNEFKSIIPELTAGLHKGSCGRVGVFGGSIEFTGAPFFAGISALKVGVDLVYVFSNSTAAPVIKSYSPELMVMPYLDSDRALELIAPWLGRLHGLVIGPGLGRLESTFDVITKVIQELKSKTDAAAIVFDADGLYYLMKNPTIIKDYQGDVYCTPNIVEFKNFVKTVLPEPSEDMEESLRQLTSLLGPRVTVLVKGPQDLVYSGKTLTTVDTQGSFRRCGGQGDLLSGVLGAFAAWASIKNPAGTTPHHRSLVAANAATLTRICSQQAFAAHRRSMTTLDMIQQIQSAFESLYNN